MSATLDSVRFRQEREQEWKEFANLLRVVEKRGLKGLSAKQLDSFPHLHARVTAALAVVRESVLDQALVRYLEGLAARGHLALMAPQGRALRGFRRLFTDTFPPMLRASWPSFVICTLVFLGGFFAAKALVAEDISNYHLFMPQEMAQGRNPATSVEDLEAGLRDTDHDFGGLATFAAELWGHNSAVGLLAFTVALLLGVPAFYLLFHNGMILGAFVQLYVHKGLGAAVWGWLLPHGIPEILAILIFGTAGVEVLRGVLFPGDLSRRSALERGGRRAGVLAFGGITMLIVAALTEGLFRQMVSEDSPRFVVAALVGVFWLIFLGFSGERRSAA